LLELDDGSYLAESNAMLHYLAQRTPFFPSDALAQSRALSWMFFEQYSHEPFIAVLKFHTYWGDLGALRPEERTKLEAKGQAALEVMSTHLGSFDYFTGATYGIADIALFAYTQSAAAIGFRVPGRVEAWLERVRERPGHVAMKPDPTR
jgi:glutathione S-transferase